MGIFIPSDSAADLYTPSQHAVQIIVGKIKHANSFQISGHNDMIFCAHQRILSGMYIYGYNYLFSMIFNSLSDPIH